MARIRGPPLWSFLAFVILFQLATVQAEYQQDTRFNQSVDGQTTADHDDSQMVKKQRTFNDHETRFIAYKDSRLNMCYLERMRDSPTGLNLWQEMLRATQNQRTLYVSDQLLTKIEAWRLAGGRIVEFCRGRSMALLQEARPVPGSAQDPFLNEISEDENDIVQRRVSDVVSTPLSARAKREIQLEERDRLNSGLQIRQRRQAPSRGRFRGQTQSQYLNFGDGQSKEGKAEARVTHDSSHAVVSGTNGMGQAQGMSSGGSDCDGCPGYPSNVYHRENLYPGRIDSSGGPGQTSNLPIGAGVEQPPWSLTGGITPPNNYQSGGRVPGGRYETGDRSQPTGGKYQYPSRGGPGRDSQFPSGGGTVSGIQFPSEGGTVSGGRFPSGGGLMQGGQFPSGGGGVQGGPFPSGGGGVRNGQSTPGEGPIQGGAFPSGGGPVQGGPFSSGGGGVQNGYSTPGGGPIQGGPFPSGGGGVQNGYSTPGGGQIQGGRFPSGGGPVQGGPLSSGGGGVQGGPFSSGSGGPQNGHSTPGGGPIQGGPFPSGGSGVQNGYSTPGGGQIQGGPFSSGGGGVQGGPFPPGGGWPQNGHSTPGGGPIQGGPFPSGGGGVQNGYSTPGGGQIQGGPFSSGSGGPQNGHLTPGGGPIQGGPFPSGGSGVQNGYSTPGGGPIQGGPFPSGGGRVQNGYSTPGGGPIQGGPFPSGGSGVQNGYSTPGGGPIQGGPFPSGGGPVQGGPFFSGGGGVQNGYSTPGGGPIQGGPFPSGGGPVQGGPFSSGGGGVQGGPFPSAVGGVQNGHYTSGGGPIQGGPFPSGGGPVQGGPFPSGGGGVQGGPFSSGGGPVQGGQFPLGGGGVQSGHSTPGGGPIQGGPFPSGGGPVQGGPFLSGGDGVQGGPFSSGGGPVQGGPFSSGGTTGPVTPHGHELGGAGGGAANWQYPYGGSGYPPQLNQYPGQQVPPGGFGQIGGQDVGHQGGRLTTGRYDQPGAIGGETFNGGYGSGVGYPVAPGSDDDGDSQASSSVQKIQSGTKASASAQGKYGQGTAQSQVQGTYSGSGSFSAQAGTNDGYRGAQSQVSGGKQGATSNAEGSGGRGLSQAQVQLHSNTGATSSGAQSSGWNHGTNSQVQTGSKGGMADAQANGEGSTSSQAQIGFQPYDQENDHQQNSSTIFLGGGTASAQSGTFKGQSQAQLNGRFKYGISYNGAAQAGSGSGAQASRKAFNFSSSNTELFKQFSPFEPVVISSDETPDEGNYQPELDTEPPPQSTNLLPAASTSASSPIYETDTDPRIGAPRTSEGSAIGENVGELYGVQSTRSRSRTSDLTVNPTNLHPQRLPYGSMNVRTTDSTPLYTATDESYSDANADADYDYRDDDTVYDTTASPYFQSGQLEDTSYDDSDYAVTSRQPTQFQQTRISKGNYGAHVIQDSTSGLNVGDVLPPEHSLPGYTIPPGFRGRVTSVSGSETLAEGDGNSQSQTVSLIPGGKNVTYENRSRESAASHARSLETPRSRSRTIYGSNRYTRPVASHYLRNISNPTVKPNYYTITNSVTGQINGNKNSARKYEHRYYTKSSTCGYFTFSCNVVYGSNGRTKICKPKVPTNPDGSPIRC